MAKPLKTDVLQFGTSRFLQAHADLFFSQATEPLTVTVVQTSGDASRAKRLKALAVPEGFPVIVRGIRDQVEIDETHTVSCVKQAFSTATDWDAVCEVAKTARFIVSNTSEKGFSPKPEDTDPDRLLSASFPAKLAHILAARFQAACPPPVLLPTELIAKNGDTLKGRVIDIAKDVLPLPGFQDWLVQMPAANSIVDRIVSEALQPAGAVAEPYALWAIQKTEGISAPCEHPAIQVFASLAQPERLKLHILNLGHTLLADWWFDAGEPDGKTVLDCMRGPEREALEKVYDTEVIPLFANRGLETEARLYAQSTLERFANPFLDHKLSDIAANHNEKIARRVGDLLSWSGAIVGSAPSLEGLVSRI
ncbi:MAG: mannitol dehydrogenase family protein [Oceanicola sp.]|nr:mannitol dehydrogenase family protein [Oceanicola sp.]